MPLRAKITNPAFADIQQKQTRMASSSPPEIKEQPGDEPDDVQFNTLNGIRLIELNRPRKLNSLNGSMARKIVPRLLEWKHSQLATIIVIAGAGEKAFCAGGDVAELAKQNSTPEGQKASTDYFALEYQLDHLIATYNKPYISLMDGITMGGGVGLSVHAPFRIATERTVFAMPETTIGFFPDVGGSFFLPRLDGAIGAYLALTSERLNGREAVLAGIATHYIHSSDLKNLMTRLSELVFEDDAAYAARVDLVNATILEFTQKLPSISELPPTQHGSLTGNLRSAIDRCFSKDTIEDIIAALEKEQSNGASDIAKWAGATLKTLSIRSPTSLKVTLKQLQHGRQWSIAETFVREHALAGKFMAHPDFVEGVTARLIDKPTREPKWKPAKLEDVSEEEVDRFFKINRSQTLTLLNEHLQGRPIDYRENQAQKFDIGLPTEKIIRELAKQYQNDPKAILTGLETRINPSVRFAQGLAEKVDDVLSRMKAEEQNTDR